MAEKLMSRASKWDVAVEAHVDTEIKHDYALPVRVVDSCAELVEPTRDDHDYNQILRCHEAEPFLPMNVAAKNNAETEIKHDNALTATADDSCMEVPDLNQEIHGAESCLPMNMDSSGIDRSDNQSGQVENNDVTHSYAFCENAQKSKQLSLEDDRKVGFKEQDLGFTSQEQIMEYSEYQDKPQKGTNGMSPVPEERKHWNHEISPTDGWRWSGRKRSRSFSYDSRSRSPSHASKQGWESWGEKGSSIHHDSGSTGEKESRFERGRHQEKFGSDCHDDSRHKINYTREKNFRRHEHHFDENRDNNEQHRSYKSDDMCFDFTRGHCYRGSSCRYVHHETSSDGRGNIRDELSGRVHDDRRDGRTSLGHRFKPHRVSSVPCTFFLEGRCNRGENCKFFHPIGPLSNSEERSLHKPSDAHHIKAATLPNHSIHHPKSNPHQFIHAGQVQSSHIVPSNIGNQQNHNINGQIQQNPPPPHNEQSQPKFNLSSQIQKNLPSHTVPSLVSNPERALTSGNKQISLGHPLKVTDLAEAKPSVFNSDNLIAHKLVTSEQAAKITDLSASLAQFFGTSALNSQTTTEGSKEITKLDASKVSLTHSSTSAPTFLEAKPLKEIHMMEEEKSENPQNNKELSAKSQNGLPEVLKNGDFKKSKETKGFRMFKCALVEAVKDMLKPAWKEGQLSKEAHNTIVKKVVDKVTGSLQGPDSPQTQEKIDLYFSSSKAKLSKFVQAYVEKYVGR